MSEYLLPASEGASAYTELFERVSKLIEDKPESITSVMVPHCPKWTVKCVLSHMIGVPEDVLLGQMDGVTTEAWTQRQVDRHSEHSTAELLAIWGNTFEKFEALLPKIPQPTISQFVFDQVTHEHDIRHAISQPGARDSRAIAVAEGFVRDLIARNPDPEINALADSPVIGFDFVRSFTGRRSKAQIAELGLPAETVVAFIGTSPFDVPAESIVE
jgi:uncharacterized protein (TIGR03083 family)